MSVVIRRISVVAFLVSLALASTKARPANAQSAPGLGPDGEVGAEVRVAPGAGLVRGRGMPILRASAGLRISPSLLVGGETVLPLDAVRASGSGSTDRSELELRYGGVRLAHRRVRGDEVSPWRISVLVGAGTARVRSPMLPTDLGTDNFVVLEPSLERSLAGIGPIEVGGLLSYRVPWGVEDLPGVRPGDLRGMSMSIFFGIGVQP